MASLSRAALARPAFSPVAEQRSGAPQETRRGPAARSVGPHDDDGSRLHLGDTRTEFSPRVIIDVFDRPRSRQQDARAERRYQVEALRAYGRTLAPAGSNLAKCGRVSRSLMLQVTRSATGTTSIAGLVTCGSVWACPVCAGRVQLQRAAELTLLVERARADALGTCMVTLTVRHGLGHELRSTRAGVLRAWKHVLQSRAWKRIRERYQVAGYVRAVEVTHGRAGWHPHIHVLLLSGRPADMERNLHAELSGLWRAAVVLKLGREHEPDDAHGCHVAPAYAADYIAKMGLEIAYSVAKVRGPSRSPFELLADASRGDAQSRVLWCDYVSATKGARQLEWSRGLRARFGLAEVTDEELAARAAEEQQAETLLEFSRSQWEALNRAGGVLRLLMHGDAGASPVAMRAELERLIREHERQAG